MRYNLKQKVEAERAFEYLTQLVGKEALVEITKVSPKRTLSQNSYFYLLLSYWGTQTGHNLNEAKTIFKRDVNTDIFVYDKGGAKFLKSSAELSKEDMQICIDRFMAWSAEQGIDLPKAEDKEFMTWATNQVELHKHYL